MTTQIYDTRLPDTRASFIPIGKLSVHPDNVRRTDRRAEIETLAASIEAHGLLQNLTVVAREDGRYAVVAGGRRLAALKLLAKQGRIARDFAAPCTLVPGAAAREASLAENVQRVAMDVMDEVEAFAALAAEGLSVDDIARRFGTGTRRVEQRLALARLSPKIKAAYRKGEMTLDAARAFCLSDDPAQQEAVFKQLARPIGDARSVRAALTQGRMPAHDRLARFVGMEAYEAAGGQIVSDLFDESAVFLDAEIVRALALEKSDALAETVRAEGWGWTEATLGYGRTEGFAGERLTAMRRPLTDDQRAESERLAADIARLDGALSDVDDAALWEEREAQAAALDAIVAATEQWNGEEMACAGALISIDHDGAPRIDRGLIRRVDAKRLAKLRNAQTDPEDSKPVDGNCAAPEASDTESGPRLTRATVRDLTTARTRGLRAAISGRPHVALALLVAALTAQRMRRTIPGVGLTTHMRDFGDEESAEIAFSDSDELFERCLLQSSETLLGTLAGLVAATLDFVHEDAGPMDRRLQQSADDLAVALDLDMTRCWRADSGFWLAAPKALMLEAIAMAPQIEALAPSEKAATLAAFARMKKGELATATAQALEGVGWLPALLVTPNGRGALALTDKGEAVIAAADAAA